MARFVLCDNQGVTIVWRTIMVDTSRWTNFFGTGALLMPPLMGFGTDSIDNFALTELVMLLMLLMAAAWEQNAREAAGEGADSEHDGDN